MGGYVSWNAICKVIFLIEMFGVVHLPHIILNIDPTW